MERALLGAAGLLVAGAITPGPNNLVVLREAARGGWRGAAAAIAGIVAGGLVLLGLVSFGVGAALAAAPRLVAVAAVAGCAYLVILGVRLATAGPRGEGAEPSASPESLPAGVWGLLTFQFLNPKAWVLVLAVTAAAEKHLEPFAALPALAALFVVVPTVCLALWSSAGVVLERWLRGRETPGGIRVWVDRAMGLLLVASAVLLSLDLWR